jgi:hypothetical protein
MAADGRDGSAAEGTVDGRESLDVPEWVSELRRLYVEPKTRAKLRQEGVIAPQKRRLGLPSGRGSRRGAVDAPVAPVAPAAGPAEQADRAVAVPAPVAPEALRPAVLAPTATTTLLDESGAPYTPPDRSEEEKVATFLTTYLVATGHATGDEPALAEPDEPATDRDEPAIDPVDSASELASAAPEGPAAAVHAAVTDPAGEAAAAGEAPPAALIDGPGPAGEATPVVPLDGPDQLPVAAIALDTEPAESHASSLADPAGLPEPDASPAVDPPSTPRRAVHEGAGVLVSTGGDAATPNPAVTTTPEPHLSPEPDVASQPSVIHASGSLDPQPALATQLQRSQEALDEGPVEPMSVPGRPSTVPAVTLSWREAESFEIGVPDAEDSERAIVVEPPSQLVAQRRSRRRDIDTEGDTATDPVDVEPPPATAPVEEAPPTRASARAASGHQSGKRRRVMVVGLVLVTLALVAWYFLLRGDGDDSAAGPDSSIGGHHAVVALSPMSAGYAPGASLV